MAKLKPKVFLSHIHAEAELAKLIQKDLLVHLLGAVDVFVSSDPTSNPGGSSWLHNIEDNLRAAEVLLILASPCSIERPWINVEAGAGWIRYLQARASGTDQFAVMPLCHSGLTPGHLPLPWSTFNSVEVRTQEGLQQVLDTCARAAEMTSPSPDLDSIAASIQALELRYTRYQEIERRLISLAKTLGISSIDRFKRNPHWPTHGVRESVVLAADSDITWLKDEGHVDFQEVCTLGSGLGKMIYANLVPTATFLADVLPNLKI